MNTQTSTFNKPSEILIAAKAVITDPKHWIKHDLARTKEGYLIGPVNDLAVCFCSVGAFYNVVKDGDRTPTAVAAFEYLHTSANDFGANSGSIADMNDSSDHATVMSVWDKAIELAKQAETV